MAINDKNPSFLIILDKIVNEIILCLSTLDYFSLNDEQKLVIQQTSFKIIKNTIKYNVSLSDDEIKSFIVLMQNKNVENQNFEIAQILKDILINYNNFRTSNKNGTKVKT